MQDSDSCLVPGVAELQLLLTVGTVPGPLTWTNSARFAVAVNLS
jgi:hypothetical protein